MATIEKAMTRWMAPAALLGGAVWVLRAVWLSVMPAGCVGAACSQPGHTTRDSGLLTPLIAIAVALMAVAVTGLIVQTFQAGRMGRIGRAGVSAVVLAGLELGAYGVARAALHRDLAPLAAMSGPLLVLGIILTGVALLRAGALHRSAVMALMIGSVAMLGYNDQTSQALLAIPFGVAWMVLGLTLLLRTEAEPGSSAEATTSG